MAAHSVAAAHATIAARAGPAPGAAAAPAERRGFRLLSSLAGRGVRSPLPARRAPAAARLLVAPPPERRARRRRRGARGEGRHRRAAREVGQHDPVPGHRRPSRRPTRATRGSPWAARPMGHILYDEVMRYNPKNPYWFNRDRFVLSAGHGCMLQYALLHLAGYDSVKVWLPPHFLVFAPILSLRDLLVKGIANAVGLALAEKHLAARFNKPDSEIVDHYT
ncbi:hypothetical protein PR202_gb18064 [Eleusine coracana subsp. coracana]|uniref:Transketolase N-terminal domain-containing protein n=1 Tax=Eleusine coracana subsp. coracana TaxID=191504 RepID=A0AAV5F4H9_ELECO|nr:hypothetical protein PR202_gb17997 [Eleusine coracana subsp. coracana]GJN29809.1 hypothetical protein PR202_gb18064 [Eleusine coracana subsp. coracana]